MIRQKLMLTVAPKASVLPPLITLPLVGVVNASVVLGLSCSISGFRSRGPDQHASTDWDIRTAANGGGSSVWSSLADATNKLTISVPALTLTALTTYYLRARLNATRLGAGPWSTDLSFATVA